MGLHADFPLWRSLRHGPEHIWQIVCVQNHAGKLLPREVSRDGDPNSKTRSPETVTRLSSMGFPSAEFDFLVKDGAVFRNFIFLLLGMELGYTTYVLFKNMRTLNYAAASCCLSCCCMAGIK